MAKARGIDRVICTTRNTHINNIALGSEGQGEFAMPYVLISVPGTMILMNNPLQLYVLCPWKLYSWYLILSAAFLNFSDMENANLYLKKCSYIMLVSILAYLIA